MCPLWLARLRPTTRVLLLVVLPLGGILALGSGFSLGEWGLVVLGTLGLVLADWWQTRQKGPPDVASVRNDSRQTRKNLHV
jgi:hypothetical protein